MSETWFFFRGLVRESGHWAGFLEKFSAEFPQRKVVGIDLPGTGTRWQEHSPASVAAMVELMRPEFLAKAGGQNFAFALSLGAMVASEWMRKYPQDFAGGLFLNTSFRGYSPIYQRLQPGTYGTILGLFATSDALAREEKILRMTSNVPDRHSQLAKEWAQISAARPVRKGNAFRQLLAAAGFSPPLNKPGRKLLLMNSAGDRLCSPRCTAEISRRWGVKLLTHPTGGHDLTLDDPQWVIDQIRNEFEK